MDLFNLRFFSEKENGRVGFWGRGWPAGTNDALGGREKSKERLSSQIKDFKRMRWAF